MKAPRLLAASVFLLASIGASATVTYTLGGGTGPYLALSGTTGSTCTGTAGADPCSLDGTFASISGGKIFTTGDPSFAALPAGTFGGNFLSAGPTPSNDEPATMTFASPISDIGFLWGSPDTYNLLTVETTMGNVSFTTGSLGFTVQDGDQSFSQYVWFHAKDGAAITALVFDNNPATNAFEVANFSVSAVPEAQTYALMLFGLGALAMFARRRRGAAARGIGGGLAL
ncbi:MAG TPA: PEP-CTERM sorting domain-containing protein [Caldimonas sp.]|nr:PEP-CTERM sorting domain-containing protein [Caldimonas sp.]